MQLTWTCGVDMGNKHAHATSWALQVDRWTHTDFIQASGRSNTLQKPPTNPSYNLPWPTQPWPKPTRLQYDQVGPKHLPAERDNHPWLLQLEDDASAPASQQGGCHTKQQDTIWGEGACTLLTTQTLQIQIQNPATPVFTQRWRGCRLARSHPGGTGAAHTHATTVSM